MKLWQKV